MRRSWLRRRCSAQCRAGARTETAPGADDAGRASLVLRSRRWAFRKATVYRNKCVVRYEVANGIASCSGRPGCGAVCRPARGVRILMVGVMLTAAASGAMKPDGLSAVGGNRRGFQSAIMPGNEFRRPNPRVQTAGAVSNFAARRRLNDNAPLRRAAKVMVIRCGIYPNFRRQGNSSALFSICI